MKVSSGTTAVSTSSAAAVPLLTLPGKGAMFNHLIVVNTGTTDGFVFTDAAGAVPIYLPKASATLPGRIESWEAITGNVLVQRASSDLTGVYAWAEWVEQKP